MVQIKAHPYGDPSGMVSWIVERLADGILLCCESGVCLQKKDVANVDRQWPSRGCTWQQTKRGGTDNDEVVVAQTYPTCDGLPRDSLQLHLQLK